MMFWISIWFVGLFTPQDSTLENAVVTFEITHMGVLTVEGQFDELNGEMKQIAEGEWLIQGEVDVKSIDTGNATRDETILTEQYLDAENFPTIPFEAKLNKKNERWTLTIDLRIRGIEFQLEGNLKETEQLISEPITFKRSDIDLDFGLMDSLIGDEIKIIIDSGVKRRLH